MIYLTGLLQILVWSIGIILSILLLPISICLAVLLEMLFFIFTDKHNYGVMIGNNKYVLSDILVLPLCILEVVVLERLKHGRNGE